MLRPGIAALFFFHHDWQNTKYTLSHDRFYFTIDDVHSSLLFQGGGGGWGALPGIRKRNVIVYAIYSCIRFMFLFVYSCTCLHF